MTIDYRQAVEGMPESDGCRFYRRYPYRVGIICDRFLFDSFEAASEFVPVRREHWREDLMGLDLLLVVSAWHGLCEDWTELAVGGSEQRALLCKVMDEARARGIPVVFYSKEDPPSYFQFRGYATHADCVFTSAVEMVDLYRQDCGHDRIRPLRFCVNPLKHNPVGLYCRRKFKEPVFSGSWYVKFPERCATQMKLLDGALASGRGLVVFNRASGAANAARFRFPDKYAPYVHPALDGRTLRKVHKLFDWAINVNSIEKSETMFANRVYELLAGGSLLVSNPSVGMERFFPEVFVARTVQECAEILSASSEDEIRRRRASGIRRVMSTETCFHRVAEIFSSVGFAARPVRRTVLVVVDAVTPHVYEMFNRQDYRDKLLFPASEVSEALYRQVDAIAFFDESVEYDAGYLTDMMNAFKYTAADYVTNGAVDAGNGPVYESGHRFVDRMSNRSHAVFWRSAFEKERLFAMTGVNILKNGYSLANHGNRENRC